MINELIHSDLTTQLNAVKAKQVSASELASQQLAHIEQVNPKINAFISINGELVSDASALASAENSSDRHTDRSQFGGVSIAVKDNIDVAGFNTTAGMETRRNAQAKQDSTVASLLRKNGATFSGKLNMHEGALGATNQNSHFGNCHNPHQYGLTPGGSSGGSGAAVASCMASVALGTDTMGSVRIPASYCGVFGFKPSRGAVSNRGSVACGRVMDNIGPIARSARDLTLVMNILANYDPLQADSQAIAFIKPSSDKVTLLVPNDLASFGVTSDIINDFNHNIAVFESMGHEIRYFDFNPSNQIIWDFGAARRAGLIICEADMRVEHQADWEKNHELFSPYLQSLLQYIDGKTPMDVSRSYQVIDNAIIKARQIFEQTSGLSYILLPTTPQRAFSFDSPVPANQADLTSFANLAGLPAVSIPMLTEHKLPAGMQLIGEHGTDFLMLDLAEKWQNTTGYQFKAPTNI